MQGKKRVCVDVGGTFTDCLVMDETGVLRQFKASTTPNYPSDGFMNAMQKAAKGYGQSLQEFLGSVSVLIHGTTLATNILLTGRGAKTGMLTTKNFRDIVEIRRGIKPVNISLYNVFIPPNRPLVPRSRRIGVDERVLYDGTVATPLNEQEVVDAVAKFRNDGVQAVAVCYLHSYINPDHERRTAALVKEIAPDMYVTTSSDTLPIWREFERFNTTMVGAYVGPAVANYLTNLQQRLKECEFAGNLLMMQANGLVQTVEKCIDKAVYLLHSGPAAAPSGAVYLGDMLGKRDLISVDMGGTSFDVCLIQDREIPTTTESWGGDQRVAIKMVEIETIGAGGGSIGDIDSLGLLKVGPQSAGADPGPACYGKGDRPTVTDADVLLGYIPHDYFLGGDIKLDLAASRNAMKGIAEHLKRDAIDTAEAMFTTVNASMADLITEVSTKRGHDVRESVLVAAGGGGPTHGGFIAKSLGLDTVVIPQVAGLFSAFGMFAMDPGEDYVRSHVVRAANAIPERINELYEDMEAEAVDSFRKMGIARGDVTLSRTADMRYIGQFHEVETEVKGGEITSAEIEAAVQAFTQKHEKLYAFSMPWKGAEILALRVKATVRKAPFQLKGVEAGNGDASGALKRTRRARFEGKDIDTPVYDGDRIRAGDRFAGPAIVEEPTMTVVVPTGFTCTVDKYKNYVLTAA
ncbi:MAG: hydantoinase/oxoprolinase family protein [Burkholderiaceae bacterium]|nr:hydantoinase/oxoprolinase family protein [Burkholderiaceae bacterium]